MRTSVIVAVGGLAAGAVFGAGWTMRVPKPVPEAVPMAAPVDAPVGQAVRRPVPKFLVSTAPRMPQQAQALSREQQIRRVSLDRRRNTVKMMGLSDEQAGRVDEIMDVADTEFASDVLPVVKRALASATPEDKAVAAPLLMKFLRRLQTQWDDMYGGAPATGDQKQGQAWSLLANDNQDAVSAFIRRFGVRGLR